MMKRRVNLDLLRILAMLGIILFHHFGNKTPNHFVELTAGFSNETYFYDFINNIPGKVSALSLVMDFCYGHFGNGGNYIFMLITGYFLYERTIIFTDRVRTAGKVLYAILFYGIILTVINFLLLKYCFPFEAYKSYHPLFNLPNWLSGENLWYLQAYCIFILLFLPLIKHFVQPRLTRSTHLCLASTLAFMNLLAYTKYLPSIWISNRMLEFSMCYLIGGYFSKYKIRIGWIKLIICAGAYLAAYFTYEYYWRYACAAEYENPGAYSYISVMQPYICCIIFALICFSIMNNIRISSKISGKLLKRLASATMGIYIFHFNVISISLLLANDYWWDDWSQTGYFLFAVLDSMLLFAIGFALDILRQWSYKGLESVFIRQFSELQMKSFEVEMRVNSEKYNEQKKRG
ncbi:MAG: acyltransferase [Lachnospiraceae bacterium]|nr:acyltransferase [Lachnospiraceae bacterium]